MSGTVQQLRPDEQRPYQLDLSRRAKVIRFLESAERAFGVSVGVRVENCDGTLVFSAEDIGGAKMILELGPRGM
jgi:hypothetical protein